MVWEGHVVEIEGCGMKHLQGRKSLEESQLKVWSAESKQGWLQSQRVSLRCKAGGRGWDLGNRGTGDAGRHQAGWQPH